MPQNTAPPPADACLVLLLQEYKGEPDSAAGETENKPGLITGSFAKSLSKQVPVVLARQIILTLRNKSTTFGRLVQCIVMGILTGKLPPHATVALGAVACQVERDLRLVTVWSAMPRAVPWISSTRPGRCVAHRSPVQQP